MATRSFIFVQVDKDDIGREIIFNHKKLPNGMARNKKYKVPTTTILKKYIGVYCHYDGYPENVGLALAQYYTNKEDILNLISGGFIRALHIDNETWQIVRELKRCGVDYFRQRGDIFNAPINTDSMPTHQAYNYLFKNGEWYFCECSWGNKKPKWKKLLPYLKRNKFM